jgi:hypothetical protein
MAQGGAEGKRKRRGNHSALHQKPSPPAKAGGPVLQSVAIHLQCSGEAGRIQRVVATP